jgi:Dolichyl-phosphate-mannose-protein mannosyltransferase
MKATLPALSLLLAAAVVRLAAINSQLWLDEIWSIGLAQVAATPLGVFTNHAVHHDNNHWLNTLVLQWIGPGRPFWMYHLLPEATGIGTVLMGWLLARRYGVWPGFCAIVLLGMSDFLIEYSSEARGYAPAGFFALLCFWLLLNYLERPRPGTAVMFSVSAVLGLLSHLTFIGILLGLAITMIVALVRREGWAQGLQKAAACLIAPMAIVVLVYIPFLGDMVRGGGPVITDLTAQTAQCLLGIPANWRGAAIVGAVAWGIAAVQVWRRWRAGDRAWPMYLTALLIVPMFLLLQPRNGYVHPRYIYVVTPLLLLLLSVELGHWMSVRWRGTAAAMVVLVAYAFVNAILIGRFLHLGRGDFQGALVYMIGHSSGPDVVVATTDRHPISTLMVLDYYNRYDMPQRGHLMTLPDPPWGNQWPQWLVSQRDLGKGLTAGNGVKFVRRLTYPDGADTSGEAWTIYEATTENAFVRPENQKPFGL